MSTDSSVGEVLSRSATRRANFSRVLEVSLVYAGILYYIWCWQFTHPRAWVGLLAIVLLSHVARRDSLRVLGLTSSELGASAQIVLPLVLAIYLPLVVYSFTRHLLVFAPPGKQTLISFVRYGSWCLFQQYLTQSYFHHRVMCVIRNPHRSSLLVGLMFGAAHIPNPILVAVTTAGGFLFAEVFARHRNIWPLALAQAVGGVLVAAITPASLVHNMRVGPGYFFYGLR